MTDDRPLLPEDAAEVLHISRAQVLALANRGELAFVALPSGKLLKPRRIQAWSVRRLLEDYDAADAKSHREAQTQEAAPRRGDRRPSQGPLASKAVGSGDPLRRHVGPAPGDVVVRRVESRGRVVASGSGGRA